MTDLITRLSKLDAPDREVDRDIDAFIWFGHHGSLDHKAPAYTASIDAVIALAERVLPGCRGDVEFGKPDDEGLYCARIYLTDRAFKDFHKVPAIALLIALLRAKEASK